LEQTLKQGVHLTVQPSKQFKTTRIVVNFLAPLQRDTVTKRSLLASLLETNSKDYPTQTALAAKLSQLYGASFGASVSRRGQLHCFSVSLTLVNDRYLPANETVLTDGLAFLKQVLFRPNATEAGFDAATFQREKQNLAAYLADIADNKQAYASLALQQLYFADDPAQAQPSFGNAADLAPLTAKMLWDYYQQMLATDQVEIVVLGQVVPETICQALQDFPFTDRAVTAISPFYQQALWQTPKIKQEKQAVVQGKLNLAYQQPVTYHDADFVPMLVTNALFGGSALSLLFANVREKASLAYYASSRLDTFRGTMFVQTGIEPKNYQAVLDIIQAQLTALQQQDFELERLEKIKATLINDFVTGLDSVGYLMNQALMRQLLPNRTLSLDDLTQQIQAVTPAQIAAQAAQLKLQAIYFLTSEEENA
jgi:predicted Zn-dependent peptidase